MFERSILFIKSIFIGFFSITLFLGFFIFKAALFGVAAAGGWHLYNYFFGVNQPNIPSSIDYKKIQDEINQNLPKKVDEITVLNYIQIDSNIKLVTYRYDIKKEAYDQYIKLTDQKIKTNIIKSVQNHAKKNFCENPALEALRFMNFTAEYIYKSNGSELFSVQADNKDCSA